MLSKTDCANDSQISAQRAAAEKLADWDAMVALSSQTGRNVEAFVEEVVYLLPEGPAWFPPDMETDQPLEVMIAEFVREKILRSFRDEVPHAIGVQVEELEFASWAILGAYSRGHLRSATAVRGIIIGRRAASARSAPRRALISSICSAPACVFGPGSR